jgi:hypothetical protein
MYIPLKYEILEFGFLFEIRQQMILMAHHYDEHFTKNCINSGWKIKFLKFGNWHFSASFSQVYLGNDKRLHTTISSQHNPLTIKIGWKIQILYTFQICEISEFGPLFEIK